MLRSAAGFADAVFDSQSVFRGVLDAMARPGRIVALKECVAPSAPLSPAAGAIVTALADEGTPVFLDAALKDGAVFRMLLEPLDAEKLLPHRRRVVPGREGFAMPASITKRRVHECLSGRHGIATGIDASEPDMFSTSDRTARTI